MLGPKKTKKKICNTKPLYLNFGYVAYLGFFSLIFILKKILLKNIYLDYLKFFWSPAPPYISHSLILPHLLHDNSGLESGGLSLPLL